jgi:LPS O-antigen subunit length determinant protein (WzzB/FepE family)
LQEKQHIEDEIDLKELFNTIWQKKLFIVLFTFVITLCAGIYAYTKTPIYEVKSIMEIGFIEKQLVEEQSILEQKLNIIFSVNDKNINNDPEKGIVSSISPVKTVKNFIEIKTEAISNEIAIAKSREILEYTQKLYEPKIGLYKTNTQNELFNTKRDIELLKTQEIKTIENEINFLKNERMKKLNDQISFYTSNLEKYNKEINSLYKSNSSEQDKVNSMIVSVQLVNYQNLILNAQNQISDLGLQVQQIIKDTIPKLEIKKDNINNVQIKSLEEKITNIEFKITEQNLSNTRLVGDYITSEYPAKPKKSLIIAVAFVTGFILSIFTVFFMQFVSSVRKKL